MACNSSSNIKSGVSKLNATKEASRLLITISSTVSEQVGVGDAIRYDAINEYYVKSVANGIVESEVVGIVESINSDNSKNVVIYGSINLPSSNLLFITSDETGASGGNDIFFLSSVYAGRLQNLAPTEGNAVIKSIYQIAPHGSYTGIVVNNIGYALGGSSNTAQVNAAASPDDVGLLRHYITIGDNQDVYYTPYNIVPKTTTSETTVLLSENQSFYNKFDRKFGFVEECIFSPEFTIDSSINNYYIFDYDDTVTPFADGRIRYVNSVLRTIEIKKGSVANQLPITRTASEGFEYWLQPTPSFLGTIIGSVVTNTSAYNQSPVNFNLTSIKYLTMPVISAHTASLQFTDHTTTNNFNTTNINNISLTFIVKKESDTNNVNINSYSFVNTLRTQSLIVEETNINDKLLELENRLSYLESRLSM